MNDDFSQRTVEEGLRSEVQRLRAALQSIAGCAEEYNYIGWQRIVGVMQKRANEALQPPRRDHDP